MVEEWHRIVMCDDCQGAGTIERGDPNAPYPTSIETCSACNGEGIIDIEVEPIPGRGSLRRD